MAIKKTTHIKDSRVVHTWVDDDIKFNAFVSKRGTAWDAATSEGAQGRYTQYLRAVDFIMDQWRLAKAGLDSWESKAAEMAVDQGYDWDSLGDDQQQDFIEAARASARLGAV